MTDPSVPNSSSKTTELAVNLRFAAYTTKHLYSDMSFLLDEGGRPWHIPAHKIIVATASLRLEKCVAKLTDEVNHILVKFIKADDFDEILEHIYTGKTSVRYENVKVILKTSKFLGLTKLSKACQACLAAGPTTNDVKGNGVKTEEATDNDGVQSDSNVKDSDLDSQDDDSESSDDDSSGQHEVASQASTAICGLSDKLKSLTLKKKGTKSIPSEPCGRFWTKEGVAKVVSIRLMADCAELFKSWTIAGAEVAVTRNGTLLTLEKPITLTTEKSDEFRLIFTESVIRRFATFHINAEVTICSNGKWPITYFGLAKNEE